jgi:heme/copper-type cytochrome/quinol oxidase subunit 4
MNASYAIGFILSLVLTLVAYALAVHHILQPVVLIPILYF